jgi:hypothetical protein
MWNRRFGRLLRCAAVAAICCTAVALFRQVSPAQPAEADTQTAKREGGESATKPRGPAFADPPGARRLSPRLPVWVDMKEKAVIADGQVSLTKGMLEMFACTRNTKEHESIVSVDTKAFLVHTGLLTLGVEPGHPARFQPKYEPAEGPEIEITVQWKDEKGKLQSARAQDWIRDIRTQKPMAYPFVFGGSLFWKDPETGKQHYQAEGGDFVCVSNFGTAMIDIPIKSSQSNEELGFEAFAEKIPALGTPVRLVFKPKLEKKGEGGARKGESEKSKVESSSDKLEGKTK